MFGVTECLEKQTEWITFYQIVWCCLLRSSAPTHGTGDSYQHHGLLNGIDGIVLLALRLDTHNSVCAGGMTPLEMGFNLILYPHHFQDDFWIFLGRPLIKA